MKPCSFNTNIYATLVFIFIYASLDIRYKISIKLKLGPCFKINKKNTIFRVDATSALAGFHAGPLSRSNLEFKNVGFCGGSKSGNPEEKTLGARREPTTN